ncbi:multidrug resistance protein D [compost metagenome]
MGLVNPLATAIALQPFGRQAGAASALLGFLQMACAALAVSVGAALERSAYDALGLILSTSLALSLGVFVLLAPRAPPP